MTRPGPSLTVRFTNPRLDYAGGGAWIRHNIGAELGELTTVPDIAIDGEEHAGEWGADTQVDITPGSHHIEVYTRITKGLKMKVKKGSADFTLPYGDSVDVHATFGQFITKTDVTVPEQPKVTRRRLDWSWPFSFFFPWFVPR